MMGSASGRAHAAAFRRGCFMISDPGRRCAVPHGRPPLQAPRALLPRRNSGEPEAEVAAPDRRRDPVAVRRPAEGAAVVPAAAPAHPARAPGGGVLTPLPDIAVQV